MRLFRIVRRLSEPNGRRRRLSPPLTPQMPREMRFEVDRQSRENGEADQPLLSGRCWVVDGDTIVIDKVHIRLAGIDAPELDHPWGQQAKWALVKLCKGQVVTARLKPELSYDRIVAECMLPDGRDLAAEMVSAGLALDWPKFSGGKYRHLEPADARRKLWRAQLRQRGIEPPPDADRPVRVSAPQPAAPRPRAPTPAPRHASQATLFMRIVRTRLGWASAGVVILVGGLFLAGNTGGSRPLLPTPQTKPVASFVVTTALLNVRAQPRASAAIVGQIVERTIVVPKRMSGFWYAIALSDGREGWVYRDYLRRLD